MVERDTIRVAVFDDHPLYRQGVVSAIAATDGMQVVAEGESAAGAIAACLAHLPDVVILDVRMPGTGLVAAARIAEDCPATRIVMLTVSEDDEDVLRAFRAGARAYVLKGVAGEELVRILRSVQDGEAYVPQSLAATVLADMGTTSDRPADGLGHLSERERQILERVASGDSNKEIAYLLKISEKTVKHYMTNILQKLQARNRVEAALMARDAGLGEYGARTDT